MQLDVNGVTRVQKIVGDGMLIATAAGSSSYARALGGIPIPLSSPVFTLAGSNIFRPRFWKPMNLDDESIVTLTNVDTLGKRPLRSFIDGHPLGSTRRLSIRKSPLASVELCFTSEFDPSTKLLRSLFPASEE
ncbi:MAG: hypothetical protein QM811_03960 [Pirellulales bacterium]